MIKRRFINGLKKMSDKPDIFWDKRTIYVVVADRVFSDHSYPVGAYKTLDVALHNANKEVCMRGGKYNSIIYATQHTNKYLEDRLVEIYKIESPFEARVK